LSAHQIVEEMLVTVDDMFELVNTEKSKEDGPGDKELDCVASNNFSKPAHNYVCTLAINGEE